MVDLQYSSLAATATMTTAHMATIPMVTAKAAMDMPAIASMGTAMIMAIAPDMVELMAMAIAEMAAIDRITTNESPTRR